MPGLFRYPCARFGPSGIAKTENPIYVGKADPATPASRTPSEQGAKLFLRLTEHRKNIERAQSTLLVQDFEARMLVVQSGYQSSAENYLINLFKPIWNSEVGICYGFGKHGDSADTRANLRSPWDTLHPGRAWAANAKIRDAKSPEAITSAVQEHIKKHPPVTNVQEVLQQFLSAMR